jgi:hypothetical protein
MTIEMYVAIGALVVSVVTVVVSVWSGLAERNHMRLSVRPVATIPVANFENRIGVWLANKGLGPMRINAVRITDAAGHTHPDVLSHMPALPTGLSWTNYHGKADGAFIEAGKRLELLLLEGDDTKSTFRTARDSARPVLAGLTVHVEYEDLYGNKMAPVERTLSWFAGHDQ